jgi:hypothetical protein
MCVPQIHNDVIGRFVPVCISLFILSRVYDSVTNNNGFWII